MKKIILLMLFIPFLGFSQLKVGDSVVIPIKESAGVEIYGVYKLTKIKSDKKEYDIKVYFKNNNDQNIIYKNDNDNNYFAKTSLKGLSSYSYELGYKNKVTKNVFVLEPKKQYEANYYYSKWYHENDIPAFTNIDVEFNNDKKEIITNVTVPEGTLIKASLTKDINGSDLKMGDKIDFVLKEDILIDGKIAIPMFSKILGTVTDSKGSRILGKKGKLAFTIDYLYCNKNIIKLQSQFSKNLKGSGVVVAGTAVLLTPFALFIKGKNAKFSKGETFDCYVSEDSLIK